MDRRIAAPALAGRATVVGTQRETADTPAHTIAHAPRGRLRRVTQLLPLLLTLAACSPPPPQVVDVAWPGDTRDPLGPYTVTVTTRGAVERVVLVWQPGGGAPETTALSGAGERWSGAIPGQAAGTTVALTLTASGPGGSVEVAGEGFTVFTADGRCLVDGDCPGGEICRRRLCGPVPPLCADDEDCPQDRYCPAPGERCRFRPTRCEGDDDCAAGFSCVAGQCQAPGRCGDDADCPGGRCLDPPGRCADADACFEDAQCPAGEVCRDGRCGEREPEVPCPGGCGAGLVCHPVEGRCVGCTADGQCGEGHCDLTRYSCAAGSRGQPCVPCGPELPCGAGYRCPAELGAVCLPSCEPDGCPAGSVCQDGACLPEGRRFCSGVACGVDSDCESGVCFAGWCEPRQFCARDGDCVAGRRCLDARCVPAAMGCQNPGDCPAGELCLGGRCAAGRPAGACARCTFNADCASPALCLAFGGVRRCAVACGGRDCPGDALACVSIDRGVALCLDADGDCPETACGQDALEPNDTSEDATLLPGNTLVDAAICTRDVDWFRLVDGVESTLTVATMGELTVEVLDAEELPLRTVRVPAGGSVELVVAAEARWLRVSSDRVVSEARYTLSLVPMAVGCADDRFEPNDTAETGTVIGGGAQLSATACPGDTDWFRLRTRGEGGVVEVEPDTGQGPLAVTVHDGDEVLASRTAIEPMSLVVPAGRDAVTVEVVCRACRGALPYRLATRLGAVMCADDDDAPNDTRETAAALGGRLPIVREMRVACGGRVDWFVFDRPAVEVAVQIEFTHLQGDLALAVFNADDSWRGRADGNGDVERVVVPVEVPDRRLWVAVSFFGAGQTSYRLRIEAE